MNLFELARTKLARRTSDNTPSPQKITPTVLATAMDGALNHAFGAYALNDVDELIAHTGKTQAQVLKVCLSDDEVSACIDDIESAIKSREWRIYDDVAYNQTGVSPQLINKFYKYTRRHLKTFARLAITAKLNGYAVGEYIYNTDKDGFAYIDKVLDHDGQLDKFSIRRDGTLLYHSLGQHKLINTKVKFAVLTHKANPARPTGEMGIVKIYPAVLLRTKGWAYAGQFIARYAQPYVVGKQGNYSLLEGLADKLISFINGGAASIGAEDDINIHQLNGEGEAFSTLEQLANKRIQKFLLGRVKTSELSSGSRSAQQTDDTAREDRISGYLELMTEVIQHAVDAMMAVNEVYGVPINAPQGLWFEFVNEKTVDINRATRDKIYCDTGQIRLTREYMIDMVGFEEHHFVIDEADEATDRAENKAANEITDEATDKTAKTPSPVSLQLSHTHQGHNNLDNEVLTDKQAKLSQYKVNKVLSLLNDVDDFNDFQARLDTLDLSDEGFVSELAEQNRIAYMDALMGKANQDGQLGV